MNLPVDQTTPPDEDIHRRRWWTLAVLCLSLVMVVMGNTLLNVTLPTLVRELGATNTELQWIVDAYALVFGGLLLTMGAVGDRFGRKGALQIGLIIFGLASLAATFATVPAHLVATRAVQGIGAALVMPATLSILTNVFPPEERGKAIGIWAAFAGVGGAIGPVLGGWLLEHFWWGSVFFVNVPLVVLALALGIFLVPTSSDPRHTKLDPIGAVTSIVALGALLFGIIEGPEQGWTSLAVLGGFAAALVFGGVFIGWELRTDHPMLDLRCFKKRGFTIGGTSIAFAFFAMFGVFFLMTQYLQFVRDYTALEAGVRTLPLAAGLMIGAPNSDRLTARFGAQNVVGSGLVVICTGLVLFAFVGLTTPYWQLGVLFLVLGLGMGVAMAPSTGSIMASMPLAKAGVGSAVNDTSREVGGAVGVAVLGSLLNSGYRSNVADLIPADAPTDLADAVSESVGGAIAVAGRLPAEIGTRISEGAREAFTDAMSSSFIVGAGIALIAAVLAFRYMPRHSQGERLQPAQDDGAGSMPNAPSLEGADSETAAGAGTFEARHEVVDDQ